MHSNTPNPNADASNVTSPVNQDGAYDSSKPNNAAENAPAGKDTQQTHYHPWLEKIKLKWLAVKEQVNSVLNTAFPETGRKKTFIALMVIMEIFLVYMIAVIDCGMWIGDCTPKGMLNAYMGDRKYPFFMTVLLCVALLVIVYVYLYRLANGNSGRGFEISDSNVYGSARDISTEEIEAVAEITTKEAATGTILCQLDKSEQKVVCAKYNPNYNGNIAVFGPPGSGKSFCFVKPFILQAIRRRESVICTDTKGELWADTVEFARRHGYICRRIDLKKPQFSDGWDVLSELRGDDTRALTVAQIIMKNTGDEHDIHASAEQSLLKAICLYQERSRNIPPEEKTLYNAFAMLFEGVAALDTKFNAIKYDDEMRVAYEAYATFLQGSPNLRGNVVTNLANRLQTLSSPPIRELTSVPDIDLSLPGQKPCIYYVVVSDQHETMKFLASLFFSFSFLDLVDYADAQLDRKCKVPVNFLMEEFANLGEVPNIVRYLSTCRSRAINIALVVQSMGQLRKIYGEDDTEAIMSACATHVCIGFNDRTTSDYYCWRGGVATVNVHTDQHVYGESPVSNFGRSYSTGEGRREMFTAHDLMTIPPGQVFISWQRYNCLLAYTFGVNRHLATLQGQMKTISTEVTVPLRDKEARAFLRAQEEQRIMDYEAWVADGGNPWQGYENPDWKPSGKASKTKLPDIIPYYELEAIALAHSEQASAEKSTALIRELQQQTEVPPEKGFEQADLPPDSAEEPDLTAEEGEITDTNAPTQKTIHPNPTEQNKSFPNENGAEEPPKAPQTDETLKTGSNVKTNTEPAKNGSASAQNATAQEKPVANNPSVQEEAPATATAPNAEQHPSMVAESPLSQTTPNILTKKPKGRRAKQPQSGNADPHGITMTDPFLDVGKPDEFQRFGPKPEGKDLFASETKISKTP